MDYRLLISTAALLGATAAPAWADAAQVAAPGSPGAGSAAASPDAGNRLEEIVVTAQKRAENIQSVPLSIVSLSGDTLRTAGINDPADLQKLVPSLTISSVSFASGLTVRIRGFGSASNTAVDSEVASYLDGAYVPRPGALLSSFLDVKNIEVLNGPQGTLFGRNATLGAISINTNAPSTTKQTLSLSAEGGNYGTYRGTGVVNLPVSDTFAVRFAAQGSHTDGMFHNELDGKTYGRSTGVVMRLSTKWQIAPDVTWILRGDYTHTSGDGVYPPTVYTNTATPAALTAFNSFITRNGGTLGVYSNDPSYTVNQVIPNPFLHDRQYGITSDLRWSVAHDLDLRLIDSYRNWRNDQLAGDTVATSLNLLSIEILTTSKAQSHELQLVSAKDAFLNHKLGVTAGLYYAQEDYALTTNFDLGSQFCQAVLGRAGPATVNRCLAQPQQDAGFSAFAQDAKSYAGYVQGDYKILPDLSLALGVRHTIDDKDGTFSQAPNNFALGSLVVNDRNNVLRLRNNNTSVRASLSWQITDKVMAFGTFSTGYKAGGFNSGAAATVLGVTARTFAPETVKDYELGLKSTFLDGNARANITLFNTALKNFQDRSFNGTAFLIRNAGDVRSRGVDVDSQFLPINHIRLNFSATYLDSIYTNNTGAPGLDGCTGLPGCPTVQNLNGARLQFAPKLQGNAGIEWRSSEFGNGLTLVFGAGEHFTSSFLTSNNDNPQSRLPGYATTDLRLGLSSAGNRWTVELFGTNVFDKHYLTSTEPQPLGAVLGVNNTATGTTLYRGFLGTPATYGGRLSLNF